jgi:hypothetical protein
MITEQFPERMITMADCRMRNSAFDVVVFTNTHKPTQPHPQARTHLIPERIEPVVVDGCCPVLLRVLWGACRMKGGGKRKKRREKGGEEKRIRRRARGGSVTQWGRTELFSNIISPLTYYVYDDIRIYDLPCPLSTWLR